MTAVYGGVKQLSHLHNSDGHIIYFEMGSRYGLALTQRVHVVIHNHGSMTIIIQQFHTEVMVESIQHEPFYPDQCRRCYSSYGSEVRAVTSMQTHLAHHLFQFLREAEKGEEKVNLWGK